MPPAIPTRHIFSSQSLSFAHPFPPHSSLQEANNRISAINDRISAVAATAAQQSQLSTLQATVAKLAADQSARDAQVAQAMQRIYASIRSGS